MKDSKKIFPSEQETLQKTMEFVFSSKDKQMMLRAAKLRRAIYKFGMVVSFLILSIYLIFNAL